MIRRVEQYLESLNTGWQEHLVYGKLQSKDLFKMPEIDEAYKSIPKAV